MNLPLITVAMPVFNAGKFLKPALLSIINQTYTNWELILIDDGSTDDCLKDLPELFDSRIKLIRDGENKGITIRLNEAIDLANGEFFARMDSDDISHPQRFELQLNKLQDQPELDLLSTRAVIINKQNMIIGNFPFKETHEEICARPWLGFYMAHPSWMGKLDWFKKNRYKEPSLYFCEDQELLLRSFSTSRFSTLNQVLLKYRVSDTLNIKKLFKTRISFFKAQYNFFKYNNNYLFIALAIMVLIFRIIKDNMRKINSLIKRS